MLNFVWSKIPRNIIPNEIKQIDKTIRLLITNPKKKIEIIVSPALDALKKITQEKKIFDLIFIDADKGNYKNYYESCLNLINKGALIIFDNVLWHGDVYKRSINDKQTNIMRDFNKYIKSDRRVEKFILPLGDGFTICRKI